MTIDIKETAAVAGAITVIITLCALVWRYCVTPLFKVTVSVKRESKTILGSLPVLLAVSQRWPLPVGPGSFPVDFDRLDGVAEITHARLFAVLDLIAAPVFECSPDGRCIHANRALCELFEMSLANMLGTGWLEGLLPSDRMLVFNAWIAAITAGVPYEASYRVRGVETHTITHCVATASPLRTSTGEIVSYFGTITTTETDAD
jgi:PAS domain-containing protein